VDTALSLEIKTWFGRWTKSAEVRLAKTIFSGCELNPGIEYWITVGPENFHSSQASQASHVQMTDKRSLGSFR
jgi:hypothetical protein